uniref:Uncharacterized protein n=1 Tax=Arundo donax TaxID=35708 RepID=A0A0A9E1T2_ARUDO
MIGLPVLLISKSCQSYLKESNIHWPPLQLILLDYMLYMLVTYLVTWWNNCGTSLGLLPWQFFIQTYCLWLLLVSSQSSQCLLGHQ